MKKGNNILEKMIAGASLTAAKDSVNRNCLLFYYQDKQPKELKKLRKF